MLTTSKIPTGRKHTVKAPQITSYLAGAVGTAALLSAPQAEAAVTAVTFGFGSELTAADGRNNASTVGPGFGYLRSYGATRYLSLGGNSGGVYENSSFLTTHGLPQFFDPGTVIGAGGHGNLGFAYFQADNLSALNLATDQIDKNIAFITGVGNNWGWANVSWDATAKTLAINSAYVESIPGVAITVGDIGAVPEPSRALLALAGVAGVALRRRRKHAA